MTIRTIQENIGELDNAFFYKRAWLFSGGTIGLLIALYAYFLAATVFNVVERKVVENNVKVLASDVTELEQKYFSLDNSIDLMGAQALGFKEASKVLHFASRKGPAQAFLVKNNEL